MVVPVVIWLAHRRRRGFDQRRMAWLEGWGVFGNGTRFVLRGGEAQEEHVLEGALVIEVEASLVTVDEGKVGLGGEIGECGGQAVERATGSLAGGLLFDDSGFDGPGAAETAVGSDHLLDQAVFDAIGGSEALEVVIEDGLKSLRTFAGEYDLGGEQAVGDGILRRSPFAFGGDGSFGTGAVGP